MKYILFFYLLVVPFNVDWCNLMYEALWFQEVPHSIQMECGAQFEKNTQEIISQFYH